MEQTSLGFRILKIKGGLDPEKGNEVDRWSHFVNVYMLDREGNRIDRRNPQDIFTPLYNNQIPPGAAQVVHYSLRVPEDAGVPDGLCVDGTRTPEVDFRTVGVKSREGAVNRIDIDL